MAIIYAGIFKLLRRQPLFCESQMVFIFSHKGYCASHMKCTSCMKNCRVGEGEAKLRDEIHLRWMKSKPGLDEISSR